MMKLLPRALAFGGAYQAAQDFCTGVPIPNLSVFSPLWQKVRKTAETLIREAQAIPIFWGGCQATQ